MLPSPQVCERARQARDARFDGRFFVGVVTVGVYCRPVCCARVAAPHNVRFFPTAAAAREAGYRPCLCCRPETAAPTPEWTLGSETVVRVLRRIGEGALDTRSVGELAGQFGMSARRLQGLCVEHLGASPAGLARTRRLQLAKRLIDDTRESFADVATLAGYGSVRRFNDAILSAYRRNPQALRREREGPPGSPGGGITLRLNYRAPYDPDWLLDFFGRRAIPGIETVAGRSYRRVFAQGDAVGTVQVTFPERDGCAVMEVRHPHPHALSAALERVRRMFDLAADSAVIDADLAKDPLLRPVIERHPGLRVPGAWDGYELAIRAVIGQQVSVKGAVTVTRRLVERFGALRDGRRAFPTPQALLTEHLGGFGMPVRLFTKLTGRAPHRSDIRTSVVPTGLNPFLRQPSDESLGYSQSPLRD